jgi:EAL and modified HD-GYP domain-containing signal transduction protein
MGLAAEIPPDDAPVPRPDVLFARQPILDANGRLAGYELFYRGERPASPHAATSQIAVSALSDLGLEVATAGAPAYINVTSEFLIEMDPLPFAPEGVVLEISPTRAPDEQLIERIHRLHEHGYQLALDGYAGQAGANAMMPYCWAAKIDVRTISPIQMKTVVPFLAGSGLKPIAFGVDTHPLRDCCGEAGFELFQGDFLCTPREVLGNVPEASLGAVRLAAAITQAADDDVEALENAISLDTGLSLRLLRFVNSAAFSVRNQIRSVRQAIVLLGPRTVRQWATMLVLSGLSQTQGPLLATALSRGRLCETVASRLGADDPSSYFFTGMMSVADALLSMPMEQALADLPLADDVKAALLTREGGKGRTLTMAEACERGAWDDVALPNLPAEQLAIMHVEALAWADANLHGVA